jgi:hypothetical protein
VPKRSAAETLRRLITFSSSTVRHRPHCGISILFRSATADMPVITGRKIHHTDDSAVLVRAAVMTACLTPFRRGGVWGRHVIPAARCWRCHYGVFVYEA